MFYLIWFLWNHKYYCMEQINNLEDEESFQDLYVYRYNHWWIFCGETFSWKGTFLEKFVWCLRNSFLFEKNYRIGLNKLLKNLTDESILKICIWKKNQSFENHSNNFPSLFRSTIFHGFYQVIISVNKKSERDNKESFCLKLLSPNKMK